MHTYAYFLPVLRPTSANHKPHEHETTAGGTTFLSVNLITVYDSVTCSTPDQVFNTSTTAAHCRRETRDVV